MPSVAAKYLNGEGSLRAIQALMILSAATIAVGHHRSRFAAHAALSGVGALPHNVL
jgi:hypothetical protein